MEIFYYFVFFLFFLTNRIYYGTRHKPETTIPRHHAVHLLILFGIYTPTLLPRAIHRSSASNALLSCQLCIRVEEWGFLRYETRYNDVTWYIYTAPDLHNVFSPCAITRQSNTIYFAFIKCYMYKAQRASFAPDINWVLFFARESLMKSTGRVFASNLFK